MTARYPLMLIAAVLVALFSLTLPAVAQDADEGTTEVAPPDRTATGGAQTLDDILARQAGLKIDDSFRREDTGAGKTGAALTDQLGTLGGASDPELWRALRYGSADVTSSARLPASDVVIQASGMRWVEFRAGPLRKYGGYLLIGVLVALGIFYANRGKIMIDAGLSGKTIVRFKAFERFGHWLLAGSFVVLGLTGLGQLFGRLYLIPLIGLDAYASYAAVGKWIHNNFSWAFMLGLVWITVTWVIHNIPNRDDIKWLSVGGGLFSEGVHPPSRKFNAGQKLIFWSVIVLGVSISLSGLSLLFPYQMPLFAATFAKLDALGLPQLLGLGALPTDLTPQAEMQLAQAWHSIIAFVFIAIVLAHIYIGSIGMQGAYDAMGKGVVDENWAKEHHSIWYEEVTGETAGHQPANE